MAFAGCCGGLTAQLRCPSSRRRIRLLKELPSFSLSLSQTIMLWRMTHFMNNNATRANILRLR